MEKSILIFMDLLVLLALGGTMYFMRQVSTSIKVIREGKTELQQLLQQMNIHISNAQHSIDNMNTLADEKAKTIQKQIDNAGAAIDELQFIQRAAENVAQRLEKATGQSSPIRTDELKAPARTPNKPMSKAEKELADAMAARRAKAAGE
jgi:hypothetical protein